MDDKEFRLLAERVAKLEAKSEALQVEIRTFISLTFLLVAAITLLYLIRGSH